VLFSITRVLFRCFRVLLGYLLSIRVRVLLKHCWSGVRVVLGCCSRVVTVLFWSFFVFDIA
jgi:hypothetical protein